MKHSILLTLVLLLISLCACYNPPTFPFEPSIEFHDISFKEVPNSFDSLIVSIKFQDGDGDLGLDVNEVNYPYNPFTFVEISEGRYLTYFHRKFEPWDTLPPYQWPYYCTNYITNHGIEGYQNDTLYITKNENHWNILVDYFVKKNGIWAEFDWEQAFPSQCSDSFNGRFPILGDEDISTPFQGILRYGMVSSGFKSIFRNDTIKLLIRIKDRALHDSNTIETTEFILRDISVD